MKKLIIILSLLVAAMLEPQPQRAQIVLEPDCYAAVLPADIGSTIQDFEDLTQCREFTVKRQYATEFYEVSSYVIPGDPYTTWP